MGIVLEALPTISGNLILAVSLLVTVIHSYSTYPPPVNILTQKMGGYGAIVMMGLYLEEIIVVSYVHMNHLMVMESVYLCQISLVTRLIVKVRRTC
jgi:hypothetical protein